jgi:hypothetical protein
MATHGLFIELVTCAVACLKFSKQVPDINGQKVSKGKGRVTCESSKKGSFPGLF